MWEPDWQRGTETKNLAHGTLKGRHWTFAEFDPFDHHHEWQSGGSANVAPRITISTTPEGELELRLNDEGRNQLVRELMALTQTSDHFHLGSFEGVEVRTGARAYKPTDTVLHTGKVMFRPDEWDRTHFPHVMPHPIEGN